MSAAPRGPLPRPFWLRRLAAGRAHRPIVWLAGACRTGKTTLADCTALSRECDLSRPTVKAHLEAMRVACALTPVPPFHGGSRREIVTRPRVYAFDAGFACFVRGWERLREEDRGGLWGHLVLDVPRAAVEPARAASFWRDKSGREIDFVVPRGREVDAFECKVRPDRLERRRLGAVRDAYPRGRNFVVSPGVDEAYDFRAGSHVVRAIGCADVLQFGSAAATDPAR